MQAIPTLSLKVILVTSTRLNALPSSTTWLTHHDLKLNAHQTHQCATMLKYLDPMGNCTPGLNCKPKILSKSYQNLVLSTVGKIEGGRLSTTCSSHQSPMRNRVLSSWQLQLAPLVVEAKCLMSIDLKSLPIESLHKLKWGILNTLLLNYCHNFAAGWIGRLDRCCNFVERIE